MGCWHCYLSGARCRFAYLPADATAPVNPDWLYQNGSAFLVPAYPGCHGKRPLNERSMSYMSSSQHCQSSEENSVAYSKIYVTYVYSAFTVLLRD